MWINCSQDMDDTWSILHNGGRLTFWCTGSVSGSVSDSDISARKRSSNSTSEDGPVTKKRRVSSGDKAEHIAEVRAELKELHGTKYNELQYRLWSEVVVSGMYSDKQNPPPYPMFGRNRKTPIRNANSEYALLWN